MPTVEVHLLEGYQPGAKTRLCEALTDAVRQVVPASADAITVMIHELPRSNYMRGRIHRSAAPAAPDPIGVVRDYLSAMEARDLEAARTFLAPGFEMIFPGSVMMTNLEELVAWSAPRYRSIGKTFDGFDVAQSGEATVVYCRGALSGEAPDGASFSEVRFVDRFELAGGLIRKQEVWNDLAEARAQP